ncbi:GNAT family protein [Actinomycetes bacterium KLBMP 9797]
MDDVRVALRPAVAADFWLFERQAVDPGAGGVFNWSGFKDVGRMRRRFDENGLVGPDDGCLIVVAGETVAGTVVWHKAVYGAPAWSCWNIGISLLPEHRGRGVGTRAQRQLVSYLLDTTPVTRIEAYTDVENHAEQRALEKAGFVREGTLRSTQFREGRWRDMVIYSVLRDEARSGS